MKPLGEYTAAEKQVLARLGELLDIEPSELTEDQKRELRSLRRLERMAATSR